MQKPMTGIIIRKRRCPEFSAPGTDLTIGLQERRHVLPAILRDSARIRKPILPVADRCLSGGFRVRV